MRSGLIRAVIAALLAGVAHADERVEVGFVHPEKFADAGRYWGGEKSREANLAELAQHIEQRAGRLLPQGQTLLVAIRDLDMAGAHEPWRPGTGDLRVVRSVYPPRIDLSFRLVAADGSVAQQGERSLRDLAFGNGNLAYPGDRLRHEKALIDDWLARELQP
jgi:hypothetical protein